MELVKHETCKNYFIRRMSEGWTYKTTDDPNIVQLFLPDGSFARSLDKRNDVETLRPNAAGDETNITYQYPNSTYHWDKVDEASADDGTTELHEYGSSYLRDLYNLPASSGSGTINKITVYVRCFGEEGGPI